MNTKQLIAACAAETEERSRLKKENPTPSYALESGHKLYTFEDVEPFYDSITWAWESWIPNGFLSMLVGTQGMGKSIFLLQLVGCFTNGWGWPDGTPFTGTQGNVLWVEGEDSERLNLERMRAWDIDTSRIILLQTVLGEAFDVSNETHVAILNETVAREDIVFMAVDSLSGVHNANESDMEMKEVIRTFVVPVKENDKPGIVTHHLRKPKIGEPDVVTLDRVRGSGGITQLSRSVIGLDAPDGTQPKWKRFCSLKHNLCPPPDAIGMEHTDDEGYFERTGCAPTYKKGKEYMNQKEKAIDLLRTLLTEDGKVEIKVAKDAATKEGLSKDSLSRAKTALGLGHKSQDGVWYWYTK